MKSLGVLCVKVKETTERKVDLGDFGEVEFVTKPTEFDQFCLREWNVHFGR
jgi:hypothetical protein